MAESVEASDSQGQPRGVFPETRWSVVLAAGDSVAPEAGVALEQLCGAYWYPIYGYLRRQGLAVHDAQDLAQSFFAHLLEGHRLRTVHPERGRFRSFLLASLKNFLHNDHDRRTALKRGGQFTFVSVDEVVGEERFQRELADGTPPDRAFEQNWAIAILGSVLRRLRDEHARDGGTAHFEALQPYLSGDRGGVPYSEAAVPLGLSEGAVKMAVLRLRRRFGELLRAEIAQTVTTAAEVDEEIRSLFAAVSR